MSRRALIAGRALAFFGITLVALNMRSAVASLSPLVSLIRDDFAVSTWVIAALGMIPPLCYGVFGMLAGRIAHHWGLERTLIAAVTALAIGTAARAFVTDAVQLLGWTTLLFAGIGVGNVVLPPLVKKYFPDRIALLTSLYVALFSIGNFIPPLIAVPVADATNWRVALAMWAVMAVAALIPWIALLRAHRRDGAPSELDHAPVTFKPWRSPMTWSILALFICSGFNSYSLFAWMPELLADQAGVTPATSGALLGLYSSIGLPMGLIVPVLIARFNMARILTLVAFACYAVGYAGIMFFPHGPIALWVFIASAGTLTFGGSLVLINLRTHSHTAATVTSSFVQGVGYLIVALAVLGFGIVHTITHSWTAPLTYLLVISLVLLPAAFIVGKQRFIDDGA